MSKQVPELPLNGELWVVTIDAESPHSWFSDKHYAFTTRDDAAAFYDFWTKESPGLSCRLDLFRVVLGGDK